MTLDELRNLRELAIRLNRINEEIDRLRSFVMKVTVNFDGMPHSSQQHDAMPQADTLWKYYAEGKGIRRIAREMHYDKRHVYRLLRQGEHNVTTMSLKS